MSVIVILRSYNLTLGAFQPSPTIFSRIPDFTLVATSRLTQRRAEVRSKLEILRVRPSRLRLPVRHLQQSSIAASTCGSGEGFNSGKSLAGCPMPAPPKLTSPHSRHHVARHLTKRPWQAEVVSSSITTGDFVSGVNNDQFDVSGEPPGAAVLSALNCRRA